MGQQVGHIAQDKAVRRPLSHRAACKVPTVVLRRQLGQQAADPPTENVLGATEFPEIVAEAIAAALPLEGGQAWEARALIGRREPGDGLQMGRARLAAVRKDLGSRLAEGLLHQRLRRRLLPKHHTDFAVLRPVVVEPLHQRATLAGRGTRSQGGIGENLACFLEAVRVDVACHEAGDGLWRDIRRCIRRNTRRCIRRCIRRHHAITQKTRSCSSGRRRSGSDPGGSGGSGVRQTGQAAGKKGPKAAGLGVAPRLLDWLSRRGRSGRRFRRWRVRQCGRAKVFGL